MLGLYARTFMTATRMDQPRTRDERVRFVLPEDRIARRVPFARKEQRQ